MPGLHAVDGVEELVVAGGPSPQPPDHPGRVVPTLPPVPEVELRHRLVLSAKLM